MDPGDRFINTARDALSRGDLHAGERALRAVACFTPGRADASFNLGVLHGRTGDAGGAERCYRHVLVVQPGHEGACGNLADILLSSGRDAEAERVCSAVAIKTPLSARVLGNLALVRVRRGDTEQAVHDVRRALCVEPGYASAWRIAALLGHDQTEAAEAAYRRAWWSGARDPGILMNRGEIAQRGGQIEEAIALYGAALVLAPEDPDILANLATANVDDGD